MGADTRAANTVALFPEPIRGTHASGTPLMVLGLTVAPPRLRRSSASVPTAVPAGSPSAT